MDENELGSNESIGSDDDTSSSGMCNRCHSAREERTCVIDD